MGRININFHITHGLALTFKGIVPDAIPAKDLAMVLLNLPGQTYINGCFTGIQNPAVAYTTNTIEATNDQLPDGTNVTVKYSRTPIMIGGIMQEFVSYDGMVIDQPKSPSPYLPSGSLAAQNSGSPSTAGVCAHQWMTYNSGLNSYDYCKNCGDKK